MSNTNPPVLLHTRVLTGLLLVSLCLPTFSGCSRRFWREQSEELAYTAVAEKMNDERWLNPRVDLTADPRSRFYDPYDPDAEPLPPDDPAAHSLMHCVDGIRGYKHWHKFGDTITVENPAWLEPYQILLTNCNPVEGHALVDIPSVGLKESVDLAYIHSRDYQTQIENVYLNALAVTEQRFNLNAQFIVEPGVGGIGGGFFNSTRGTPEQQRLRSGIGVTKLLPAGGQLSVDVLNTITWGLGSADSSAPRLGFRLSQPFLREGGRIVTLENLTQAERSLLYEVRNTARFRLELFTDITNSYLQLEQLAQTIRNQENNIRRLREQIEIAGSDADQPDGTISIFLPNGLQDDEIPPSLLGRLRFSGRWMQWRGEMSEADEAALLAASNRRDYQNAAQELIQLREIGNENKNTGLNVLQLVGTLNQRLNQLWGSRRELQDQQDNFKFLLGLPPNIQLTINEQFLAPFKLIDDELLSLEDALDEFQKARGSAMLPEVVDVAAANSVPPKLPELRQYVAELRELKNQIAASGIDKVKQDFVPIRDILKATSSEQLEAPGQMRSFETREERDRVIRDVGRDLRLYQLNQQLFNLVAEALDVFNEILAADTVDEIVRSLDKDGDEKISPAEMPMELSNLPGATFQKMEGDKTGEQFLGLVRDAAIDIRERLLQSVQSLQVVQAGQRVEAIALNKFRIPGQEGEPDIEDVVQVGLANRRDLMNVKAGVMDDRRRVEVAANALMAILNFNVTGTVDAVSRARGRRSKDNLEATVNFKTPLNQMVARNNYNAALIVYQRSRRAYMQLEDQVKQDIRGNWRQLMVAKERLEIDRQTVRNSALQYDNIATGGNQSNQNNSLSLLNALQSILNATNSLVGDWVSYETNRLNIYRDMGIMQIDADGIWEDDFYQTDRDFTSDDLPAPTELYPQLQLNPTPSSPAPADPVLPEIPQDD